MKSHLLQFIDHLRAAGLAITPAETLDAARALGVVGVEPGEFREAIAATLVKDEMDRATFDQEFDRYFSAPGRTAGQRTRVQPAGSGERLGSPLGQPAASIRPSPRDLPPERQSDKRRTPENEEEQIQRTERQRRMSYLHSLRDVPLKDLTPQEVEDCDALLAELSKRLRAHVHRRQRAARRGRIDLRRTIRRSIGSGGVPLFPQHRRRYPGKPDLVALCDMSHSVAVATRFLLALLGPAPEFFRRVRLFGYVDAPVEIWLQDTHLVQDATIDLYARSDFGRVLTHFWDEYARLLTRDTLLLILGDARNNRRPPRADVLARMASMAQRVVWLNPEPRERWNAGDSVQNTYTPHCDLLLGAATLRELYGALKTISR